MHRTLAEQIRRNLFDVVFARMNSHVQPTSAGLWQQIRYDTYSAPVWSAAVCSPTFFKTFLHHVLPLLLNPIRVDADRWPGADRGETATTMCHHLKSYVRWGGGRGHGGSNVRKRRPLHNGHAVIYATQV